jgi:hypothetical protein
MKIWCAANERSVPPHHVLSGLRPRRRGLLERNLGEHARCDLQTEIVVYFRNRRLKFGVRYVWLVNPLNRRVWAYTTAGSREVKGGVLRTENPAIAIPLAEVFAGLEG